MLSSCSAAQASLLSCKAGEQERITLDGAGESLTGRGVVITSVHVSDLSARLQHRWCHIEQHSGSTLHRVKGAVITDKMTP